MSSQPSLWKKAKRAFQKLMSSEGHTASAMGGHEHEAHEQDSGEFWSPIPTQSTQLSCPCPACAAPPSFPFHCLLIRRVDTFISGPAPATADAPAGVQGGSAEDASKGATPRPSSRVRHGSRPCPPYAAKSVVGQRFTMEDRCVEWRGVCLSGRRGRQCMERLRTTLTLLTLSLCSWQAVPDLLLVPGHWSRYMAVDQLPSIMPPSQQGDGAQSAQAVDQTAEAGAAGAAAEAPAKASADAPAPQPVVIPDPSSGRQGGSEELVASSVHFFAVYDGHGGADVAKHCAKNLHEQLKKIVSAGSLAAVPPVPAEAAAEPAAGPPDTPASPSDPNATPQAPVRVDGMEAALKHTFVQVSC